jgi:hypothetical protein
VDRATTYVMVGLFPATHDLPVQHMVKVMGHRADPRHKAGDGDDTVAAVRAVAFRSG